MQRLFLTRRNLLTLLSKLDRATAGEITHVSIIKQDTVHPKFPCSEPTLVTAVEDADYYIDRMPGQMHPAEEAVLRGR